MENVSIVCGRQSQRIGIASIDCHRLVDSIPSTDKILLLRCPIDITADSDKINAISTRDLLNARLRDMRPSYNFRTEVIVVNQPAGIIMASTFFIPVDCCTGRWAAADCFIGSCLDKHIVKFLVDLMKVKEPTDLMSGANFSIFLNFQRLELLSWSADSWGCKCIYVYDCLGGPKHKE